MQNSKFEKALAEVLINEYESSIPVMEEHTFSKKFERKMKKLINRRKKPYYKLINTAWKRAVCTAAAAIILATAAMRVEAIRNLFKDFFVFVYEKFSIFQSADSESLAPETIEDIYAITYDLSGYEVEYEEYNDYSVNITYVNNDIIIDYYQITKDNYDLLWNTEDSEIEQINIKGFEALYFIDNHSYGTVMWCDEKYVISISSNLDKKLLIELAKSVQKVE